MSRLTKPQLLGVVERSIRQAGWRVLYLSTNHPFRLQIYRNGETERVRIYIWNLTHGGRSTLPYEYRIQITGFQQFEAEPGGKTLILGWWQDGNVFVGFDFRRHSGQLGASPSIQIHEDALRRAYNYRFSPHLKDNQELAIAFTEDFFVDYVRNLEQLHDFGQSASDLRMLNAVSEDPTAVNDSDIDTNVTHTRRQIVRIIRERLRSTDFQARVLAAYQHRCAVCGIQLKLVQAAHIVPVSYQGSTDETCNGMALCALHHLAYDSALVGVRHNYRVMVNQSRLSRLQDDGFAEGQQQFLSALRHTIIVPTIVGDRPRLQYLRTANRIRGWNSVKPILVGQSA